MANNRSASDVQQTTTKFFFHCRVLLGVPTATKVKKPEMVVTLGEWDFFPFTIYLRHISVCTFYFTSTLSTDSLTESYWVYVQLSVIFLKLSDPVFIWIRVKLFRRIIQSFSIRTFTFSSFHFLQCKVSCPKYVFAINKIVDKPLARRKRRFLHWWSERK